MSNNDSKPAESCGSEPFASLLDGEREAQEAAPTAVETATAAPVAADPVPVTLAELLAVAAAPPATSDPAPVPAPLTAAAVVTAAPTLASAAPTVATPEPPAAAATAPVSSAGSAPGSSAAPTSPGQPTPPELPSPSPSQPTPAPSAAAAADRAAATTPGQPAELPDVPAATAATATAPDVDAAAQQPAPAQAAPQAPSVGSAPPAPPAASAPVAPTPLPTRAVGLEHAVETVRLALRAAADRGVSHARISLSPRELGGIEIHLRHTAEGVLARVVAEHATAVQLLQHAGAELRRSFEAQGLTLLQLDVGASGEQGGRAAGEQRGFGPGAGGDRRGDANATAGDDPLPPAPVAPSETTLQLPSGVLVDVLA